MLLVTLLMFVMGQASRMSDQVRRPVDIQLSYLDAQVLQVQYCGGEDRLDKSILILTSKGTVYRSGDNGRQWNKLSELFYRKALQQLSDSDNRVGVVNSIVINPVDSSFVLFVGSEFTSWLSLDCGKTITVINQESKVFRDFQWHPLMKDWVLASAWTKCDSEDIKCRSFKELLLSQDGGVEWQTIAQHVTQYSWGVKNTDNVKFIPQERILVSFEQGRGNQQLVNWNSPSDLYYSDDFFSTRTLSVQSGARFLLTDSYLFVAKVTDTLTSEVSLMVSQLNNILGYSYDTIDADQELKEHSYQILDTSENQVFMIVNHLKQSAPMGVIYVSDSTGTRYIPSLRNAVRLEQGGCEFYRVMGLEGIYLINVYADEQAGIYTKQVHEQQDNGFSINEKKGFKDEDLQRFKQSRITFDKGGSWQQLKPPSIDCEGKAIICDPKQCSLHLHLNQLTYNFGPIYSQHDSVGIILATGSIGKYLSYRSDLVNTFLSRDGGLTWIEIHKGSYIYEVSDHGGLIVMTSDQSIQRQVTYTWNEGLTWELLEFSEVGVQVTNIITQSSTLQSRFLLYGTQKNEQNGIEQETGVIISMDLDDLHQRKCVGLDKAGEESSDYELWTPSGIVNPDCLFGKRVTYRRRKREAQCFNPEKMETIVSVEPCPCTQEDYECDIGYTWNPSQQQCLNNNKNNEVKVPAQCNGSFIVSSGYRKLAGNKCQGGLQRVDFRVKCPGSINFSEWFMIILVCGVVYMVYLQKDNIRSLILLQPQLSNKHHNLNEQQKGSQQFKSVELDDENEQAQFQSDFDPDLLQQEQDVVEVIVQEQIQNDQLL